VSRVTGPVWVPTIDEAKVIDGAYVAVFPMGLGVLLARIDGDLFAVANKCVHMACPLEGGKLEGPILTCPCHDWRFDLRTGAFLDAPELAVATYPVRVEDGKVLVEVGAA
jgi:3-phenylpropionate/trans-cinnamate dioxygenase ferredoxin subunit